MKLVRTLSLGFLATVISVAAATQSGPPPNGGPGGPGGAGGPHPTGDFATQKSQILAHIDARSAATATRRSCVAAATKFDDLKPCRDQERASMEANRPAPH